MNFESNIPIGFVHSDIPLPSHNAGLYYVHVYGIQNKTAHGQSATLSHSYWLTFTLDGFTL